MYDGNNSAVLILYLVPHYISFYLLFLSLTALLMAGRTMVTCPKFPAVATWVGEPLTCARPTAQSLSFSFSTWLSVSACPSTDAPTAAFSTSTSWNKVGGETPNPPSCWASTTLTSPLAETRRLLSGVWIGSGIGWALVQSRAGRSRSCWNWCVRLATLCEHRWQRLTRLAGY